MLNDALRTLKTDTVIRMGFFIHDLHYQIEELYKEQIDSHDKSFIIYRGQGLSKANFDKFLKARGGLISFNNFLSTSKNQDTFLGYAKIASTQIDTIEILFKISIDPSISSTPFAFIQEVSCFQTEEEVLFSMHTIFRVGEINKIDNNDQLYQVDLKLTSDDDQQLRNLTKCIREECDVGTGWHQLAYLLFRISQYDKAEELYKLMIQQTSLDNEKLIYYSELINIKHNQGDYKEAIGYYEKALQISKNLPSLIGLYKNVGSVYKTMGDTSKALLFYQKALEMNNKVLPNDPMVPLLYNDIGLIYTDMGEYQKAISFFEKTIRFREKNLPMNHPTLAVCYSNIASVHDNLGDYSTALLYHRKALNILENTVLPNDPILTISYNNIGMSYNSMGDYSQALSFCKKALDIHEKNLSSTHLNLVDCYNNIGLIYSNMGENSNALLFYDKALELTKNLPPNYLLLPTLYNNIGFTHDNMGNYDKSLSFHDKALKIRQKTLHAYHPDFGQTYKNIATVYLKLGDFPKALSYFVRAHDVWQRSLPHNHPHVQNTRQSIEIVKEFMK